jgi:hypothetical protein
VPESAAAELEKSWRGEVRASPASQLVRERDVGAILFAAKHEAAPSEDTLTVHNSADLTLTILRSARREVLSQTFGNRSVRRTPHLDWDALIMESWLEASIAGGFL